MRLVRSPRRLFGHLPIVLGAALALLVTAACGGGAPAQPTKPAPSPSAAVLASPPPRPAVVSPVASPSPFPSPVAAKPTAAPAASGESYTIESGDTLLRIAEKVYGDGTLWRRIYDANKDTIGPDPDALKVGVKLTIPPKP